MLRLPVIKPFNGTTAYRAMSTSTKVPLLLSPEQYKKLPKASTIPVDCSWHMPNSPRSAVAEYLTGPRLPRARRFDLDEVAELEPSKNPLSLTHMLPSKERFQEECRKLGIHNDDHVVLYDTVGVFSSPRGAFTFKSFGHDKVSILDGGLPRWVDEGCETETSDTPDFAESQYTVTDAKADKEAVRTYEQIAENSEKDIKNEGAEVVLEHRALARYTGEAPEPRPSLSSGHIPSSLPLPFTSYLTSGSASASASSSSSNSDSAKSYTTYKTPDELEQVLKTGVGEHWDTVQQGKGLVFTCGSGMTAAVGWLANEVLKESGRGAKRTGIYDESWTGYASRKESKIVKGDKPN